MNCENLEGAQKEICEQEYCYARGSSDKTDDSCICNDYCRGSNCDGVNSWKFTCEGHTGTGSITDEACNVCTDCICSADETTYVQPSVIGSVSSGNGNIPNFSDTTTQTTNSPTQTTSNPIQTTNNPIQTTSNPTQTTNNPIQTQTIPQITEPIVVNDSIVITPTPTLIETNSNTPITPLPIESTITPGPTELPSISNNILNQNNISNFEDLIFLKDYSKIFKFILRKLKPKRDSRESLGFLYQKYKEWLSVNYDSHNVESENEFNLLFYKLFVNFEGTYVLDIEYDNFKVIDMKDNDLINIINRIENNRKLFNYLIDNLEYQENESTSLNNIYLDYSNWVLEKEVNKVSSFELDVFLSSFFERTNDKIFINLVIKDFTQSNENIDYEILDLFFEQSIEFSEDDNLSYQDISNRFVPWYSKNYPNRNLIIEETILTYLRNNHKEINNKIFSNLQLKTSNEENEIIINNIVSNYINDNLKEISKGDLKFDDINKDFDEYVKNIYPNYDTPHYQFLRDKLDSLFTKNENGNYNLKFKNKGNESNKKDLLFGFLPKWLKIPFYILLFIILIFILHFVYLIIFNKPVDHLSKTFLFKQFLPYFALKDN